MPMSEFDRLTPRQVDYALKEYQQQQIVLDERTARICYVLAAVNGNKNAKPEDFMAIKPKAKPHGNLSGEELHQKLQASIALSKRRLTEAGHKLTDK